MQAFRGSIAIVTGSGSGIGRALGQALSARGAMVVLADLDEAAAGRTRDEIAKDGGKASVVRVDVRDAAAVRGVVERTVAEHGRLDYLFNNAGVTVIGEAIGTTLADWERIVDVNLLGVIHGVVAAYEVMARQGSGHIVNTASLAGLIPTPGLAAYAASKHAVVGLSTSLRLEAARKGVKVSVVCPGVIDTPMKHTAELRNVDRQALLERMPLGFYPAEACARDILRGVERNDAIIVVTTAAKAAAWLHRHFPWLVSRVAFRAFERLVG